MHKSNSAMRVIIDGKPAAGKTTLTKSVERALNEQGISTLDAKTEAMEHGPLSSILRRFEDTEISTFRDLARSGVYHTLSYISLEIASWQNRNNYDVLLLQRAPSSFLFILDAMKFEKSHAYSEPSGLLYGVLRTWSKFTNPDLYIYLTVRQDMIEERFAMRQDGKDHIHRTMVMRSDAPMLSCITGKMGMQVNVVDNSGSVEVATKAITEMIRQKLVHMKAVDSAPVAQAERRAD